MKHLHSVLSQFTSRHSVSDERLNWMQGNEEYFSNNGIVKSIGEHLGAAEVIIFLLTPGKKKRQGSQIVWDSRLPGDPPQNAIIIPLDHNPVAKRVIEEGRELIHTSPNGLFSKFRTNLDQIEEETALIAVPIRSYGAIIGCLCVRWGKRISVAKTVIERIKQFAASIAPIAQSYREVGALDQLSVRFTGWHAQKNAIDHSGEALREVVDILQDTLSPLATMVSLNFGFVPMVCYQQTGDQAGVLLQRELSDEQIFERLRSVKAEKAEIIRSRLYIRRLSPELERLPSYLIGHLTFAVLAPKDGPAHPTLVRRYLHRRAVRALVAGILLEISRQHLNSAQKSFTVRLGKQKASNIDEWFYELYRAARNAGLQWIVVSRVGEDPFQRGSQTRIRLIEKHETTSPSNFSPNEKRTELGLISLPPAEGGTFHIIRQYLPDSKIHLWMGVARQDFGPELEFPSPWKMFLERFGATADATFHHLDYERLQLEAAEAQGLVKTTVMAVTLRHQITNLVKDLGGPLSALQDGVKTGNIEREAVVDAIASMMGTIDELMDLSRKMSNSTRTAVHSPCQLLQVAERTNRLFAGALKKEKIFLDISIDPEFKIDIPFDVAALAIATVVENAKEAHIASGARSQPATLDDSVELAEPTKDGDLFFNNGDLTPGESNGYSVARDINSKVIRIEAIDAADNVHCRVIDNGPGVPAHLSDLIFNLGESTKPEGGGWGLFYAKHQLQLYKGAIELTSTGPEGAQFTIRFPKPRVEV
jgi:signal transduction histidine kinase